MSLRMKFSIMMFLEFFIWGAWLPLAFPFLLELKFGFWVISFFMNAFAIASITASWPFVFILVDWDKIKPLSELDIQDWLLEALKSENGKKDDAFMNGVAMTYVAAGAASLLLAAFSLVLPHTPPKPAAK